MQPSDESQPARTAYWGDGHTHSNWSDGFDTLQRNTELFRQYDQDFHVAADHVLIDVSRPDYVWAYWWSLPAPAQSRYIRHAA